MSVPVALVDAALVVVAVATLWVGASQFVAAAERVARGLGLSGLVVGLTVVAFGTSAPEFVVTLDAALTASADLSVANVVGSNVVNLGFVLGGTAVVRALPVSRPLVRRDCTVLAGTTLLLFVLLADLLVSRLEGLVLTGLLAAYLLLLVRTGGVDADDGSAGGDSGLALGDLVRLLVGLAVVVGGAHLLVVAATDLARVTPASEWVIGTTVVAFGTSTPELVTSVAAARSGRPGIAAGNLVGSCIVNVLGVLGPTAVVVPLPVAPSAVGTARWLLALVAAATLLLRSRWVLSRLEGVALVALNAASWLADLLF